jgi:hypothetical protein
MNTFTIMVMGNGAKDNYGQLANPGQSGTNDMLIARLERLHAFNSDGIRLGIVKRNLELQLL